MTYLVEIKSFEDLKAKYREWALKLHPDMGGTDAEMQVLNNEYDQLFPVWKNRSEVHTKETADSDRRWFYTQNGWAGKNYKSGRTTKEIAEIIRTYLKEVYSDCKWSVRYSSASMCTSIHVALMEAPYQVFVDETKTHIDLNPIRISIRGTPCSRGKSDDDRCSGTYILYIYFMTTATL